MQGTPENEPPPSKGWTGPKLIAYGALVLGLALATILGLAYGTPYRP